MLVQLSFEDDYSVKIFQCNCYDYVDVRKFIYESLLDLEKRIIGGDNETETEIEA